MGIFNRGAAFNQDLIGWDVINDESFDSASRIRPVCYDAYYNSQLIYCIIYFMFNVLVAFDRDLSEWYVAYGQSSHKCAPNLTCLLRCML